MPPLEISPEDFIEFRAETKNELKWIRLSIESIAEKQKEIVTSNAKTNTDLTVLKTKMAIYGGIGGVAVSIAVAIIQHLLGGG